ncbi:MAG: hypothetical protein V4622_03855 [Bacteroidota bacterium]
MKEIIPFWMLPIGLIMMLGFIWIYWSFVIVKWKLWAFEKVRNVHELKKRAIQERLISKDSSFIEKTEFWTLIERAKWNSLQKKFQFEDEFNDDFTIQKETLIYYSKSKNYISLFVLFILLAVDIYIICLIRSYLVESIILVFISYLIFESIKKVIDKNPQITINEQGIKTISSVFLEWNEIKNIDIICEGSGKYIVYYLIYSFPNGSVKLNISDLNINRKTLNKLLIIYQERYKKKNTNS